MQSSCGGQHYSCRSEGNSLGTWWWETTTLPKKCMVIYIIVPEPNGSIFIMPSRLNRYWKTSLNINLPSSAGNLFASSVISSSWSCGSLCVLVWGCCVDLGRGMRGLILCLFIIMACLLLWPVLSFTHSSVLISSFHSSLLLLLCLLLPITFEEST